jgi:hypothetical protein
LEPDLLAFKLLRSSLSITSRSDCLSVRRIQGETGFTVKRPLFGSRIRDSYADALFSDNLNRFSDKPLGQTAEIPAQLRVTRYYNEGDDGLTLDDRWTEHWQPRPLWKSLHINTPKVSP